MLFPILNTGTSYSKIISSQAQFDALNIVENDNIKLNGSFIGSIDVDQANVKINGGIISGGEDISGLTWADEGGDIWSTAMASDPQWINIGGTNAKLAETINIAITGRPDSNKVAINAADVSGYSDIVGSYFVALDRAFSYSVRFTVIAYSAGIITLDDDLANASPGQTFKLYNDEEYFNGNNEWIWRSNTLKIKSTVSPSTLIITKSSHDYGINITATGAIIEGIQFKEQYNYAVYCQSNDVEIINCNIHDIRGQGIYVPKQITNVTFSSNIIADIAHNGIWCGPLINITINNNTISNIGVGENIGWNNHTATTTGQTSGTAIKFNIDLDDDIKDASNITISNNIINNISYCGFLVAIGQTGLIKRNIITNPLQILDDGGAIYCFHFRGYDVPLTGFIIEENFVSDCPSTTSRSGIYIDNRCINNEIRYNVITSCLGGSSLMINADTEEHNVHDNTIYAYSNFGIWYRDWAAPAKIYANDQNLIHDNIIIARESTKKCLQFSNSVDPYDNGGAGDDNYYINPYATTILNDGGDKTLAQLQSTYSQDASSVEHTDYIVAPDDPDNEILLIQNPSDIVLNGSAPAGTWKDVDEVVTTNYSVPAWRSLVLLKDLP